MPLRACSLVRHSPSLSCAGASGALLAGLIFATPPLHAQAIRRSPTGFNLFTVEQDIEVGRQSAAVIERQVRIVPGARTIRFLDAVTSRLASHLPANRYHFQAKVVDSRDVTVFVLPDGSIYVSAGLLALAKTEGELAAVVAHSMAHVVLRHGTARASKAYLDAAGVSALGGMDRKTPAPARIITVTGGYGLTASFLHFTLPDEHEADALGTEVLARAGYDPVAMVSVFGTARREARRHAAVAQLSARHPLAESREERIRALISVMGHRGASEIIGEYSAIRWVGGASSRTMAVEPKSSAGTVALETPTVAPVIPEPSSRFGRFNHPQEIIAIDYPDNWSANPSGNAISFAPDGALVDRIRGAPQLVQGVIVNVYAPFENDVDRWNHSLEQHFAPFADRTRPRGILEDATDDLVRQILGASPHLAAPMGTARPEEVDGARGYSVRLSGRSPVTGLPERVTVYTWALPDDHVVYLACITPMKDAIVVERTCARMIQSVRVNDAALHRN